MARTESNSELSLGTVCPDFALPCVLCDTTLRRDTIFGGVADVHGRKGLLVAFVSVHCPFVQHMEEAFTAVAKKYAGSVATVCVCSNDEVAFPEDAPAEMKQQGERLGWDKGGDAAVPCAIPYLHDASQETARAFHAACTPDLYLFNAELELVYHAQFDATRPYRDSDAARGLERHPQIHQAAHGADLEAAIENLVAGGAPLLQQVPSLGCNIKWK